MIAFLSTISFIFEWFYEVISLSWYQSVCFSVSQNYVGPCGITQFILEFNFGVTFCELQTLAVKHFNCKADGAMYKLKMSLLWIYETTPEKVILRIEDLYNSRPEIIVVKYGFKTVWIICSEFIFASFE